VEAAQVSHPPAFPAKRELQMRAGFEALATGRRRFEVRGAGGSVRAGPAAVSEFLAERP